MRYPNCSAALAALAAGLDESACHDFRAIRELVMCDAWHGAGSGTPPTPQSFRQRVDGAWQRVRETCATHGGTKPETGFLEPGDIAVHIPPMPVEVYEVRRAGRHGGLLVLDPDGGVSACLLGDSHGDAACRSVGRGPDTLDSLRSMLELQGYEVVAE